MNERKEKERKEAGREGRRKGKERKEGSPSKAGLLSLQISLWLLGKRI